MKYNVLIVDDEFLARKLLIDYVSKVDSLNLVDNCSNAIDAMAVLQREQIDIVLLDIQMPELSGIELLAGLKNPPVVIFTTAYSEHAVEAFDLGVADYLLKPFDFPRFFQAINKAIQLCGASMALSAMTLGEQTHENGVMSNYLMVKADYKLYKINYDDLLFIEGQHEYVTFHTKERRITALYTMKNLEELLPAQRFVRVHKSYIVSFDKIQNVDKNNVTVAGKCIPVGLSYRDALLEKLNKG